jgi:hypothetical protein
LLLAEFANATAADPQVIEGVWTGRCYFTATPDVPTGMYLGTALRVTSEHGPLFPSETVVNMAVFELSGGIDSYDSPDSGRLARLDQFMASAEFKTLVAKPENGSLVSRLASGTQYSVRSSGGNHFVQLTSGRPADITLAMCYFFKKVH